MPPSRRAALLVAGLCLVALALRLVHANATFDGQLRHVTPGLDRWLYMHIATAVARGEWHGGRLAGYESSPAYALLLGLLRRAGGQEWTLAVLVQIGLGALAPALLFVAGARLADRRTGMAAAALSAVYGPSIFHEAMLLKFSLLPVVVAGLLAGCAAASTGTAWAAAGAGVALAALLALRANAVAVVPVVVLWLTRGVRPGVVLAALGSGLLVLAVPLGLWRAAAATRGQQPSLWGIHFYAGNQPEGGGGYRSVPGVGADVFGHVDDARAVAEADSGRQLSPGEVSRYWLHRGIAVMRAQPLAWLALEGRKVGRLVTPEEEDGIGDDFAGYAQRSPVLRWSLGYGAVLPLGLIGAAMALARRAPIAWVAAVGVAYAAALLAFFVTGRYRFPVVPPLLLLAGYALVSLGDLSKPTAVGIAAAALLAAVGLGAPLPQLGWLAALLAIVPALARRATPVVTR